MHLTDSLLRWLLVFQPVFTAPSFDNFVTLLTGWLLTPRAHFVTECILSADARTKHFSCFHRFFVNAVWSIDQLAQCLAHLVISTFVPAGTISLSVDDTLCRKSGLTLFGAGMHHDPQLSSKNHQITCWGHDWVIVSVLVSGLSWCPTKVWALPIAWRLYKNIQGTTKGKKAKKAKSKPTPGPDHRTRPQLAVELLHLISGWFPDRHFIVVGDSLYGGQSVGRHLPGNVDLISRVNATAAMYAPAPRLAPGPKKGRGRPAQKGQRLSGMQEWANDATTWQEMQFNQFGLHTTLAIKTRVCLYYKATGSRLVRVVLTKDREGKRPMSMFYCTDPGLGVEAMLVLVAKRWACEVMHRDSKQLLGLDEPASRKEQGVRRTAPMALVLYSLVVVWADQGGHEQVRYPDRPWYPQKKEPSFADLLTAVRRESWRANLARVWPKDAQAEIVLNRLLDFASRAA